MRARQTPSYPATRFPHGFRARIRDEVRRTGDRLLVGGSPLRVIRLSETAAGLLADGSVTVTDPTSAALAARLLDGNLADPVPTGETIDRTELTVVVPVRDRPGQLARTLAPLSALHCIVVDDASRDPATVAAVAAEHGARLLALETNVGPAGARNAGLREVTTPYVAFVDSDVEVEAATLLRLGRHFADERVALVGPQVRSRARSTRPRWFERYDEQDSSLSLGTRACAVQPGAAVGWLPSACLVGRTDVLRPGFAPDMRVGEDVDLVWRLLERGHTVRYQPDEVARHDTRDTLRGWLGRKFLYGTGGADLAARHGRRGAPAVLTAPMAVTAAAALVPGRWSAPVVAVGVGHTALGLRRRLPEGPGRDLLALRLAARGFGWAVRQESGLLLRHWWPLTAVAVLRSRSVRRAVFGALLVDLVVAQREQPEASYHPVGRRLDDLAYGAGLWAGALRRRSITCLLPRRPG